MIRILVCFLLAGPAAAQGWCDDLWFTRNLVMDRAGYCFGTPLGQAVFDNADCTGQRVALSPDESRLVNRILEVEERAACRVDTLRSAIDLEDAAIRRRLTDLPVRDQTESACIGWQGPDTPVLAGHDAAADVIARIEPGDVVLYQHIPEGGWSYVTIATQDFQTKGGGWLDGSRTEPQCFEIAG
jgi:hypothetical protein